MDGRSPTAVIIMDVGRENWRKWETVVKTTISYCQAVGVVYLLSYYLVAAKVTRCIETLHTSPVVISSRALCISS